MKKLPLILGVILVCTLLLGSLMTYLPADPTESESKASTLEKYVNEEKNYSIEYPKDWQKQELPRLDIVLFAPAKDATAQTQATMNIVSEKVGDAVTLEQFYNESVKHLTTDLKEVLVEKTGELQINNLPSKWILYNHVMLQSKFRVLQYFFVANGYIYLLTFSSPTEAFDNYRSFFESIASSFRLLPKADKDVKDLKR